MRSCVGVCVCACVSARLRFRSPSVTDPVEPSVYIPSYLALVISLCRLHSALPRSRYLVVSATLSPTSPSSSRCVVYILPCLALIISLCRLHSAVPRSHYLAMSSILRLGLITSLCRLQNTGFIETCFK